MPKVLITGTSTGIGMASALEFARRGFHTVATMRDLAKAKPLQDVVDKEGLALEVLQLDVAQATSIDRCVADVLDRHQIDVLVNNAGVAGATPFELVDDRLHRAMFEANYFGAVRMMQAVLPQMRERRSGTIINISSVAGRIAVPNQIPYSASKWALEAASEALAHEVARFGIRVRIIEPGVILTNIFDNAAEHTVFDKTSPYVDIMRRNGKFYAAGFRAGMGPDIVAKAIYESAVSSTRQLRYLVGEDAVNWVEGRAMISDEAWISMGDALSDKDYNRLFKERFGIEID